MERSVKEIVALLAWPVSHCETIVSVNSKLRNAANRLVTTPVHVNRMKVYYDAKDRPIEPPAALNDNDDFSLTDDELPVGSFPSELPSVEEELHKVDTMPDVTKSNQCNELDKQDENVHEASNEQVYQIEKILKKTQA